MRRESGATRAWLFIPMGFGQTRGETTRLWNETGRRFFQLAVWFDFGEASHFGRSLVNRRVTQQDIAKQLGLDKSTVSLALRNHPGIAAETLKRVREAADQMGYRPDPALSNLARQRWAGHETGSGAALAYLVDSRMENASQHRRFLKAARQRAEERGYLVHEFDLAEYASMKAASRVLHNRGIRGLLVPQFTHSTGPSLLDLPAENFTIVCLDLGWVAVPFHIVTPDMFEGTRLVWHKVVQRGYKRIGAALLSHTPSAVDDAARYGASAASQHEYVPKKLQIPLLTTDHMDRDGFMRWFERYQPEVVIGFIERVYEWMCEAGIKVPEEVAFVSLSAYPGQNPQLSGVMRHTRDIGTTGVDALIAAMNEHEWGVPSMQRKLQLEPIWHEGVTLPKIPGKRR